VDHYNVIDIWEKLYKEKKISIQYKTFIVHVNKIVKNSNSENKPKEAEINEKKLKKKTGTLKRNPNLLKPKKPKKDDELF
jgi:hypothetical protein